MPERKRLLVLASTYPRWRDDVEPGFVHELSRRLIDDFDVTVLCPHAKGAKISETMDGVAIRRYRYASDVLETLVNGGGINGNLKRSRWKLILVPFFLVSQLWATVMTIYRLKPDVIHAHWIIPQGLILCLASLFTRDIPFMLTSHGADLFTHKGIMMSRLKSWVLKKASFVTVVSEPMRRQAMKLGVHVNRIAVMPMGVDFDKFSRADDVIRNPNEILFVGRLVEKKGLVYLIHALDIVRKEIPDIHLTIIGFGPEENKLRHLTEELGLGHYVSFLGGKPQHELITYYQRAGLFVAPFVEASNGDQEGLGLVTIEAIASGCPVLVGDVQAVSDIPVNRVDVRNVSAFSSKIVSMLTTETDNASNVDRFKKVFDWNTVSQKYSLLFSEVIRGQK